MDLNSPPIPSPPLNPLMVKLLFEGSIRSSIREKHKLLFEYHDDESILESKIGRLIDLGAQEEILVFDRDDILGSDEKNSHNASRSIMEGNERADFPKMVCNLQALKFLLFSADLD